MTLALRPRANAPAAFELKSAALTLISVAIKTPNLDLLADELRAHLADTPELFDADPVVVDVSALREPAAEATVDETAGEKADERVDEDAADGAAPAAEPAPEIDFARLVSLLREYRMHPVAVRGANEAQLVAAREAGLSEAPEGVPPVTRAKPAAAKTPPEVPPPAEPVAPAASAAGAGQTVVVDRPLRSGQQVYARGADLVVMAAVSFGAEVIADGHIHIYAPLRGRAIAGATGNTAARIFTTCMEPQLVSIAGTYRTVESALPADVQGKPAQVRLDGERLVIEPLTS